MKRKCNFCAEFLLPISILAVAIVASDRSNTNTKQPCSAKKEEGKLIFVTIDVSLSDR